MDCGAAWVARWASMTCTECGSGATFHDDGHDEGSALARAIDVGLGHVTASDDGALSLSLPTVGTLTASSSSRTIGGAGVAYGVYGRTSRGLLKVRDASALRYPPNLAEVVLTEEHDRSKPRGVLASMEHRHEPAITYVQFRAGDGPEGDAALREANDGTRAGLSFDIVDAVIEGDEIVDGYVVAFGQCAIPAFSITRVDSVAASLTTPEGITMHLTPEQMARLVALTAQSESGTLTDAEQQELDALKALAALYEANAPEPSEAPAEPVVTASNGGVGVTASTQPAVPGGIPSPSGRPATRTASRQPRNAFVPGDFEAFLDAVLNNRQGGAGAITAALADITYGAHNNVIAPAAWSNELWSGVQYEPLWADLFEQGPMLDMKGEGWRFVEKMEMQDYAGNKAAIPTSTPETEASPWVGARMAVGGDIDRAFFDFDTPANRAFLASLAEQARESWPMKLDVKVRAYALANAVAVEGPGSTPEVPSPLGAQPTLLKAAAVAIRALRRRRVIGRTASTWVVVNDDDLMSLMEYNQLTVPAFLDTWGLDPANFRSDVSVPAGTVLAGAKQAAKVLTLPGSPIRVDAQHIANGGIDEAFFGYWAIEQHHKSGIARATYTAPAA